jgi:hypothetical protein
MAAIEELGNPLTSSKHFDQPSGVVSVQIVYGGRDSNILTLLGSNGVPNKTYIEFTPAQHTERNVINQASAPTTLDPHFSRVFQNHRKAVMIKKIPKRVLTAAEEAVQEARRKAQQANDLAANAKMSAIAGKSKNNSKSFMGSRKNNSKRSTGGQQNHFTVAAPKTYAAAARSSAYVSPPTSPPLPPTSTASASTKKGESARVGDKEKMPGRILPPTSPAVPVVLPPSSFSAPAFVPKKKVEFAGSDGKGCAMGKSSLSSSPSAALEPHIADVTKVFGSSEFEIQPRHGYGKTNQRLCKDGDWYVRTRLGDAVLWKDRWYHRSMINGALTLFDMMHPEYDAQRYLAEHARHGREFC